MTAGKVSVIASVLSVVLGSLAFAEQPECRKASGKTIEYVADASVSPNDPFGRVLTSSTGTIDAIGTAILTSVGPGPSPGALAATTRHLFVTSEHDQLTADGVALFTPIPNSDDVNDSITLTITGGVGKFKGATGTIVARGIGFNFLPGPTAGRTFFVLEYKGRICAQ